MNKKYFVKYMNVLTLCNVSSTLHFLNEGLGGGKKVGGPGLVC